MSDLICIHCGSHEVETGHVQSTGYLYFRPIQARFLTMKTADIRIHSRMCLSCGSVQLVGDTAKGRGLLRQETLK